MWLGNYMVLIFVVCLMFDIEILKVEMFGLVMFFLLFDMEDEVIVFVNDMFYGLVLGIFICDVVCVYWVFFWFWVGICWVNIYWVIFLIVFFGGFN